LRTLVAIVAPLAALSSEAPSFEEFLAMFGLGYADEELPARRARYQERLAQVAAHNAKADSRWTAGINEMSAATEEELAVMRGYVGKPRGNASRTAATTGLAPPTTSSLRGAAGVPATVDWRNHSPAVVTAVKNQGACGSCWAFATTEVVETHLALKTGVLMDLAPQQLVSCVPAPKGAGGCQGNNPEMAMRYLTGQGINSQWRYPYLSGITRKTGECLQTGPFASRLAGITGFDTVPTNDARSMVMAVAQNGPVAVIVAAKQWPLYSSGIYDGCDSVNVGLDHAVVLVGYGLDEAQGQAYWLIRNSWGTTWGEKGYMRLARYPNHEPCGVDGGDKVCGECGVLSNGAYPLGGFLGRP